MFTVNVSDHTGKIWLCGNTISHKFSTSYDGEQLQGLHESQEYQYADLKLDDEGEYTLTANFSHRTDARVFAGYWYTESGSFEPELCIIVELYNNDPFTFIYKKDLPNRYYGGISLITDIPGHETPERFNELFEDGMLDISFSGYPVSVDSPLIVVSGKSNQQKSQRCRILGATLRGLQLPDGSRIYDRLELREGRLTRLISPEIDNCICGEKYPEKYILPFADTEAVSPEFLPEIADDCSVCSNVEIELINKCPLKSVKGR